MKRTITLDSTPFPIQQEADVIGALAIHGKGGNWTLTHVPTGRAIQKGIETKVLAVRLRRVLLASDMDWAALTVDEAKRQAPKIRRLLSNVGAMR